MSSSDASSPRSRATSYLNPSVPVSPRSLLTPLRKHHKLLKDGSGLEVWPEYVEQVFVQGLQAYSKSIASHTQPIKSSDSSAPGRSRLRNAFLVSYLAERGIDRSRKQVASHLQVLKNMWKVEDSPNYHLVAGFEQLQSPSGYPSGPVIMSHTNRHPSPAFSSTSSASSSSPSPSFMIGSPIERLSFITSSSYSSPSSSAQSSPLGTQQSFETRHVGPLYIQSQIHSTPLEYPGSQRTAARCFELTPTDPTSHTFHQAPQSAQQQQQQQKQDAYVRRPMMYTGGFKQALAPAVVPHQESQGHRQQRRQPRIFEPVSSSSSTPPHFPTLSHTINRHRVATLMKLSLDTDGMLPLLIELDKLFDHSGQDGAASLRLQLDVPKPTSSRVNLKNPSGFDMQVQVNLSVHPAQTAFKCITQVWGLPRTYLNDRSSKVKQRTVLADHILPRGETSLAGELALVQAPLSCLSREEGIVGVSSLPAHGGTSISASSCRQVLLIFPDSALSRCRWLEQGAALIHQELSCDGQVILHLTYYLRQMEELPAAALLEWELLPSSAATVTSPFPSSSLLPLQHHSLGPQCKSSYLQL
ncbi:hypothetical protein D9757_001921 [Collybiopsis confluens]|uniref:TEA domain-containing protein n=1 Tax=Collybiopsis confluens TaxID=2823264 RepID=A0A8H5HX88_9AGAR|nr:hypothetical protein D9757_001921 [Collybiopsis confluens]